MHKIFNSPGLYALLVGIACSWAGIATAQDAQALTAVCTACHGSDGNGPIPDYPKLAGLGEKYLLKQLQDIRASQQGETDGSRQVDLMAGMLASMTDANLEAIAAYYANQPMTMTGATGGQTVKLNSGENVDSLAVGENLYRYGNQRTGVPACSGCHSPKGLGNAPAGYPRLGGQHPNYVAQQLRNFRGGERTNDGESQVMRQVAELMSDAEISAVANYVAGLH